MNITQLYSSYYSRSGEQHDEANLVAAHATIQVIHNHLLQVGTFFTLILCCRDRHTCNFYNNLMEKLFHMWGISMVRFVVFHKHSMRRVNGTKRFNLILTDSFQAFREIDIASDSRHNNYNEYYYIFLQVRDAEMQSNLQQIFAYCWANSMINCSVQTQNARGEIMVYSYFPFTDHFCGSVEPTLISRFNGTHFLNSTLFPRKLKNFHGCVLRAAIRHIPPFTFLHTDERGVSHVVGGIEGHLLRQLSEILNFTIEVKVPPDNIVFQFGAIRMLQHGEADMGLGAFSQRPALLDIVSAVSSYYQTRQILCVSKEAYSLNSLELFIFPFDAITWSLIWSTYLLCWVLFAVLSKCYKQSLEKNVQPFLNTLSILLGMPTTHTPMCHYGRLLFIIWLCFTLLIRAVYQGVLFTYAHHDTIAPVPSNLDELVARNFTTVISFFNRGLLTDVELLRKLPTITTTGLDGLSVFDYVRHVSKRNYVAIETQDFLRYYKKRHNKTDYFVILSNDFMNFQSTMYLAKHSFLIDQFEQEIWWIRSAGLVKGWYQVELNYRNEDPNQVDVIVLGDVYVVFVMLGIGLGLALLVFGLEILSLRVRILKSLLSKI
ncbi:uncharacterized protein LOC126759881 [Bactrocera neohumeralis]|uniref:uncharacterized protein LOC126759881 n=1 Tax=Bactrocera neohumeralis TaxID=98809 RepID=UPI002165EE61|nr:uncharacterized protein LOC126759881 [Bactrocera neohumeralis]